MAHKKNTIPKFGNWDKDEDISYSIAFDKARAEKEYFLHIPKEDENDRIRFQNMIKANKSMQNRMGVDASNNGDLVMGIKENYDNKSSTVFNMNRKDNSSSFQTRSTTSTSGSSAYTSSVPSFNEWKKPEHMAMESNHVNQSVSSLPELYHGRLNTGQESLPGPRVHVHEGHQNAVPGSRSHLKLGGSGSADKAGKTAVPRFGDWDAKDRSSDGDFSVIFDRVREEKHPKPTLRPFSSLQSPENLYMNSQPPPTVQKSQRGWRSLFCCFQSGSDA